MVKHTLYRTLLVFPFVMLFVLAGCDAVTSEQDQHTAVASAEQVASTAVSEEAEALRARLIAETARGEVVVLEGSEAILLQQLQSGAAERIADDPNAVEPCAFTPPSSYNGLFNETVRADTILNNIRYKACQQVFVDELIPLPTIPPSPVLVAATLYGKNDYQGFHVPPPTGTSTVGCRTTITLPIGTTQVVEQRLERFDDPRAELTPITVVGRRDDVANLAFTRQCRHTWDVTSLDLASGTNTRDAFRLFTQINGWIPG